MDKVEGFSETDVYPSGEAETRWIWSKFTRPLGFRLAANHFVRRHRTWINIDLATFRVNYLAIRETELLLFEQERL
ncbi:hypothetical protein [Phyllobacterium ifriqiyense]|uniref:hypothetical protein n=1 Tax=Phyllobacterium ifriqiyense TaxID=314238 RepID=UPI00339293BE